MEQQERDRRNARIERFIILTYTVYALNIGHYGVSIGWPSWTISMILFGYGLSFLSYITKYRNMSTRGMITTVSICVTIFIRGIYSTDFANQLPSLLVLTGLVGLYGVLELLPVIGFILLVLVMEKGITGLDINNPIESITEMLLQFANIFFYMAIVYVWVKGKRNSSTRYSSVEEKRHQAEKAKADFVANVSHEIRTPLNVIYGTTEMLESQSNIGVIQSEIKNIQLACRRLISTVSDILDYSELLAGETELEEEIYDLTTTINDVINMTNAQIGNKDLELIVDLDVRIPKFLVGDEKKIRRIVLQLVDNAVKFTQKGCVVVKISGRKESYGINLIVSVQDTGIGMSDEQIEKLFTDYSQADTERNRRGEGVGLGIAISRLLANKLGGALTVRSTEGVGSQFTLVVPQKTVSDEPVIEIKNAEMYYAAYYFDLERYYLAEIRDAYSNMIHHMVEQFSVNTQMLTSIEDLKRRVERSNITHLFINQFEYNDAPEYFNELAKKIRVSVILNGGVESPQMNEYIIKVEKPFYSLQVAMIFNHEDLKEIGSNVTREKRLMAPNAKILIVDDNETNIYVTQNLLKRYQMQVDSALSGMEAIKKTDSMDYDIIFMDHMMPGMDGVEATHRIRDKIGSYYKKLPIVAFTANAVADSREMFLREGFNDFLEKPIEISVLERVLQRNLPADKIYYEYEENTTKVENTLQEATAEEEKQDKSEVMARAMTGLWEKIDRETGMMYCGGEEGYTSVIAKCVMSYPATIHELRTAYETGDYELYGIKAHALKSIMKSIGAKELAEQLRVLEMAGKNKENNIIDENHEQAEAAYRDLMEEFMRETFVQRALGPDFDYEHYLDTVVGKAEVEPEENENLQEMAEDIFAELVSNFERAMYDLDRTVMFEIAEKLTNRSVKGSSLNPTIKKVKEKIEEGDYFSAGDLLTEFAGNVRKGEA